MNYMQATEVEEFLCTLPDTEAFAGKNLYIWGIGEAANLHQEGLEREKSFNIQGYTVSKGYEISNYTHWGGGKSLVRDCLLLKK